MLTRHKHKLVPKSVTMQHVSTGRKGSTNRKIIAGIIVHHPLPAHSRQYTLHATKGYRSSRA